MFHYDLLSPLAESEERPQQGACYRAGAACNWGIRSGGVEGEVRSPVRPPASLAKVFHFYFLRHGIIAVPGAHCLGQTGWPLNSWHLPISAFPMVHYRLPAATRSNFSSGDAGDLSSGPLVQQTLTSSALFYVILKPLILFFIFKDKSGNETY